ncbi:TRAP transporter substrate-binding protein [Agrobacterium sp. a22-2]|uniref:TRAP transporter substrate-binding protein n=1 Tax=Agrobacterium sp. a22-2 TaxID=2283840 RepID=UPI0014482183|nr:TRAP transporter substrate-binding protein [Agrobacterium sp. a22-2]NKN36091.1 TRAP transporter substrate-binding protein [Agrobacterium sp. a22-2]
MKVNRRTLLLGAATAGIATQFAIRTRPAHAAEFTYKFANNQTLTHPMNVRAKEAVAKILEESSGRVAINIFPSSQLGADTDMLGQVRSGGVEFFSLSPLILSTLVPNASLSGIGFAFPNYDAVWPAMDGDLGTYVRGEIAKKGLVTLDKIWDNGFRQISSSKGPIATPADLKSFKIRVPVSPLWTSMFSAFGAAPASINFAETYTALQTGVVDGQENPLAILSTAKLYEVQKFVSMTNHMWDGFWILANRRAWEALPDDMKDIVSRNFNAAAELERKDVMALNQSLRGDLEGHGMTFNVPDPVPFQEKLRSANFYSDWKGKYGDEAWAILEKAVGKSLT